MPTPQNEIVAVLVKYTQTRNEGFEFRKEFSHKEAFLLHFYCWFENVSGSMALETMPGVLTAA